MLAPTHSIFGIFLTLIILAIFGVQWSLHWTIILFAVIGSIIPDIDHPRSLVGRIFSFISIPLERRYGHRTLTHSIIGWIVSTVIFTFLVAIAVWLLSFISSFSASDLAPRWIAAFSISYLSHLVLDMLNPRGCQMFWPDTGRDVFPGNPKFRPESGSKSEVFIFCTLLVLLTLALPLSRYGLVSSLRWVLATPASAIEEYKSLKNHAYLDFEGVFRETKEPVKGKAEILDVDNKRLVILYKGTVYSLSDELAADITASNVRVKRTNDPIKVERREFSNETRTRLLSQIPKNSLVFGVVHLPKDMDIEFPPQSGAYRTLEQKKDDLVISFATKEQIEKLGLSKTFELQNRKEQAELTKLKTERRETQDKIEKIKNAGGLTPLGRQLLGDNEEIQKSEYELAGLENRLQEIKIKEEEIINKIESRKFVFSGEVYIRH